MNSIRNTSRFAVAASAFGALAAGWHAAFADIAILAAAALFASIMFVPPVAVSRYSNFRTQAWATRYLHTTGLVTDAAPTAADPMRTVT